MSEAASRRRNLSADDLADGIRNRDRVMLARAITLVESAKPAHRETAQELLQLLLADTGNAYRIGITGVPGAGKSTMIDQFGTNLTQAGHEVAVLAVDPTSSRTGGSILGDKTRMGRLSQDDHAFIRPSPTSGSLGGVTRKTRETMALCEAAGFDIVIVETVGVGQSETSVAGMVDVFLVLALAGAGDDLQGIKKGVLEIADILAVNKADGDNVKRANRAASDLRDALRILGSTDADWTPPVLTVSGQTNAGLDNLWETIGDHREAMKESGTFEARRRDQAVTWMHDMLEERLKALVTGNPRMRDKMKDLEAQVRDGSLTPALAVEEIAGALALKPDAG